MPIVSDRRRRAAPLALMAAAALSLAACAEDIGPPPYSPYAAGAVMRVEEGVVLAAEHTRFRDEGAAGAGGMVGGVAGGVLGSQIGRGAAAHAGFGVAGAVVGALAGDALARNASERPGFIYTIRMARDGTILQILQADAAPIPNGEHVYVSFGPEGARVRLIGGYVPPPGPPNA